jgi:oxygen-dependent protoporphyrinogen oxidase
MAAALVGSGVQIRTRTTVRGLTATETGWDVEVGPASAPEVIHADGVIVATPAAPAARLLADVVPNVALELSGIEAASVAVIALAYRSADFRANTTGSGLLIPPVEGRMVKAVTFLDQKWGWLDEAATREGLRLVRLSIGRHGDTEVLQRTDEELVELARIDLAHFLGVDANPIDSRVTRWGGALPQYAVGHRARLERISQGLREQPSLAVCGASYDGVGVAACVGSAYEAAGRVAHALIEAPGGRRG